MGAGTHSKPNELASVKRRKLPAGHQRRLNDIERIQHYFNRPIDRKFYRPSTRIMELALPKARIMFAAKEDYKRILSKDRMNKLNETTKEAMFTRYTQLSKTEIPKKFISRQPKKWTTKDWENFWSWYQKQCVCFLEKKEARYRPKTRKMKRRKPLTELLPRVVALATPKYLSGCHKFYTELQKPVKKSNNLHKLLERPWYKVLNQKIETHFTEGVAKREKIDLERCIVRKKIQRFRDRYRVKGRLDHVLSSLFPNEPSQRTQELAQHKNFTDILARLSHKIKCHQRYIDTLGRINFSAGGSQKYKVRGDEKSCTWFSNVGTLLRENPYAIERLQKIIKNNKTPRIKSFKRREPKNPTQELSKLPQWKLDLDIIEAKIVKEDLQRYFEACNRTKLKDPVRKRTQQLYKMFAWIQKLEENEMKAQTDAKRHYTKITRRKMIKRRPSSRTEELAKLTDELLEEHKSKYYEWLKQEEEYQSSFKPSPKALKFKLNKRSRLHKLSQPRPNIEKKEKKTGIMTNEQPPWRP